MGRLGGRDHRVCRPQDRRRSREEGAHPEATRRQARHAAVPDLASRKASGVRHLSHAPACCQGARRQGHRSAVLNSTCKARGPIACATGPCSLSINESHAPHYGFFGSAAAIAASFSERTSTALSASPIFAAAERPLMNASISASVFGSIENRDSGPPIAL